LFSFERSCPPEERKFTGSGRKKMKEAVANSTGFGVRELQIEENLGDTRREISFEETRVYYPCLILKRNG
jgi:hypothetical protein